MSIQTAAILKSYFETGDVPTQTQYIDLVDTIIASNLRTVKYIVGAPGVTGCNHTFTSVANTTEQSIQLGSGAIIPAKAFINNISVVCTDGLNGAITGTVDIGPSSGSNTFGNAMNLDDTNEILASSANTIAFQTSMSTSASSVYFSFTPSANWDTITNGKWEVYITYIDNSLL